jgi:hypothetical protein
LLTLSEVRLCKPLCRKKERIRAAQNLPHLQKRLLLLHRESVLLGGATVTELERSLAS